MSEVITIENVGKKYKLGQVHNDLLTEKIGNGLRSLYRSLRGNSLLFSKQAARKTSGSEFWALKDVNLTVHQGEVVGIIGRNGAGKSTLLKILSRITEPTTGRIAIKGRVGSLLEVGTGFHPELTGRENIFLNGAILGMSKNDIKSKFDEIVGFAEIEQFIDTPVKRYSSGMYVRLAFAVAAHLDTEILILDEVLAVGDAAFQKKCMGKMRNVSEGGRTVLFVSHNMTAIRDLCNRAILLTSGTIFYDGKASEVVLKYLNESSNTILEQIWPEPETAPGNDKVRLRLARLTSKEGTTGITVCTPLDVEFEYWNYVSDANLNLSLHLYNLEGICVFNSSCVADNYPVGLIRGICNIPGGLLNDGTYRIMIMIVQDQTFGLYTHDDILMFDVQDVEREGGWHGKWPGVLRPTLEWTIEFNPANRG